MRTTGMGARLAALVLFCSFATFAGRALAQDAPHTPDTPEVIEARVHLANGETFFNANNFDGALVEYQRAYDLLEGKPIRYIVLFNIGQCHERMFRYDQALSFYQRYLDEGGPEAEDRATVQATMRALEGLLGTVNVTANVPHGAIWVDQREVGPYDGDHHSVRVPAGIHSVEIRATGWVTASQQVSVAARASATATFHLEKLSDYHGIPSMWFWTTAISAGVIAAIGFSVGIYALAEHNHYNAAGMNPADPDYAMANADTDARIVLTANIADILFGVAGALGITAVVLAFMTDWGGRPAATDAAPPPATQARVRLAPSISPTFTGLSLTGDF